MEDKKREKSIKMNGKKEDHLLQRALANEIQDPASKPRVLH